MQIGASSKPLSRDEAAKQLAKLIEDELDLELAPDALLRLFDNRWSTLSRLAHDIHSGKRREPNTQ